MNINIEEELNPGLNVNTIHEPVEFKPLEIKTEKSKKEFTLRVSGAIFCNEIHENLQLVRAAPQSANPRELVLEFKYYTKRLESKKVYSPFHYSEPLLVRDRYVAVKIIYDGWISDSYLVSIL